MPGVPGSGGPVPKPSAQRRRRNKPVVPVDSAPAGTSMIPAASGATAPAPDDAWHPIARDWFVSLGQSGQARFYVRKKVNAKFPSLRGKGPGSRTTKRRR